MSIIKNAKEFFGLAPADAYHDDAYYGEDAHYEAQGSAAYQPRREPGYEYGADYGHERAAAPAPSRHEPVSRGTVTRSSAPSSYVPAVVPVRLTSFTQSAEVGEPFRDGDAVVFDLSGMDLDEAKRVLDFASGLCFALRGQMKKLVPRVFAIIPDGAAISMMELEEAARLR
ncbi:cell division protein SepF [Corynebacterium lowii]|uniref:Cell division protein SepF n=1 Tax=Corynebacterium lowii TaxID=1544413 RepID=A0A0Q0UKE5_9CORY|nr:cell division protein SepF [Corynebacterium lowii]KQB86751.1 Cell division protein SepF [Corynebacterium lowii]MDP9851437.1 cell division inhibitor SepF [Corynebacterium lowii]